MEKEQNVVVVQQAGKSTLVAVLLAIFFGPIGMMYSTVSGGIIMFIITLIAALITFGIGLFITWPICVIWAALAADRQNKNVLKGLGAKNE